MAGRKARVSPPLPLPSAQNPIPRPPQNPPQHKEKDCLSPLGSKFIGLSQLSGTPGFVVLPSRPPRQGREPKEPLNYNPHHAMRARGSPRPARHALPPPPRTAPAAPAAGAGVGLSNRIPHHRLCSWRPSPSDLLPRCRRSTDRFAAVQVGLGWGIGRRRRGVR